MSSAAVIRYARCFSTGTREQLPHDLLDGADSELREAHEYFIALRSKHFAHSVNPFEENDVTVQIGDHFESSEEITEINSVHGRTVGLSFSDPEQLKQLAEWVHLKVRKMMEEERVKLLGFARMRPLAELKAYGIPSPGSDATRSNVKKKKSATMTSPDVGLACRFTASAPSTRPPARRQSCCAARWRRA